MDHLPIRINSHSSHLLLYNRTFGNKKDAWMTFSAHRDNMGREFRMEWAKCVQRNGPKQK
jgi:hypothetical protein